MQLLHLFQHILILTIFDPFKYKALPMGLPTNLNLEKNNALNALSVIHFRGFTNDEHYQHWNPYRISSSKKSFSKTITLKKKSTAKLLLTCAEGSMIHVDNAFLIQRKSSLSAKPNDQETCPTISMTLVAQTMCQAKRICQLHIPTEPFQSHSGCHLELSMFQIQYKCISDSASQLPLYDGKKEAYREGVTPWFLVLPDHIGLCPRKKRQKYISFDLISLLDTCTPPCLWVEWHQRTHEAILCNDFPPALHPSSHPLLVPQPQTFMAVAPRFFREKGFAIYLNFFAICEPPKLQFQQQKRLSWSETVKLCIKQDSCRFFIYTPSYREELSLEASTWLCKGNPTLIPRDGWITGIRVS